MNRKLPEGLKLLVGAFIAVLIGAGAVWALAIMKDSGQMAIVAGSSLVLIVGEFLFVMVKL